ncbi:alpha/beta fold hydrolase [Beijerinckia sp. L45]|uniref:alpha/beta fold hydrolase n=1 Tax=Beijerinckia sp. L45 TaxID=1641855 RepID=UPI00131E4688|nr:alpha/beta hydrolase [Beijerinckia sp. L45]
MDSVTINNHPMTYTESGKGNPHALVLLSGWAQDDRLFKNLEPLLAKDFHVLCPNYRGHDAEQTLHGDFTEADLVDDVAQFIAAKKLENFHLVSTSHGCWVNIDLCDKLGLDRTMVIDWLMTPHDGFYQQLKDGQDPERYQLGRQSFFDEWVAATDNADVINHIRTEMPWFKGEMWMRACREIEKAYRHWGSPLDRMQALAKKPEVLHIYSQPLSAEYRDFQAAFAKDHPWFHPCHVTGQTHFPTLESPVAVSEAIRSFVTAA